jgi:hypothetical protein
MPAKLAEVLGLTEKVRAIPIVDPVVTHSIGLVVPQRNPLTPLINALVNEAKHLAPVLSAGLPLTAAGPNATSGTRKTRAPGRVV